MSDADEIERIIETLHTGGSIDREDVAIYFNHLTARIAELEKALTKIESGSFPGATEMALTRNWKGIVQKLQEIARTTLEASERGGE